MKSYALRPDTFHTELQCYSFRYQALRVRRWTGFDRVHGRPVMIERLGEFFGSDNHRAFDRETWLRCYAHDMANHSPQFCEATRRSLVLLRDGVGGGGGGGGGDDFAPKLIQKYVFIADTSGLGIMACMRALPLIKACTKEIETNYPEIVDVIILTRVPAIIAGVYNKIVKRFLNPAVAAKVNG